MKNKSIKRVLITGATGQTASYLCEYILKEHPEYEIHCTRRWRSREENLDKFRDKVIWHHCELRDSFNVHHIMKKIKPEKIFVYSASSYVRDSWFQPMAYMDENVSHLVNIMNSVLIMNNIDIDQRCDVKLKYNPKIFVALSSEEYGHVKHGTKIDEKHPLLPVSPYGVSKCACDLMAYQYNKSYGMNVLRIRTFNHESVPKNSPIMIKDDDGIIDIFPIEDVFKAEKHKYEGILEKYKNLEVWNGSSWTRILGGTCYKEKNKGVKLVQTRKSSYEATFDHVVFDENDKEIATGNLEVGTKVFNTIYPEQIDELECDSNFAKFLGFLVGDGSIDDRGRIRLTGTNVKQIVDVAELLCKQYGWKYRVNTYGTGGFENCEKDVYQLDINNDTGFGKWLKKECYTLRSLDKKVPKFILNSNSKIKQSFFDGYYEADGRKKGHENYKYKGFATNSAVLCLGLNYIFQSFSKQAIKTKCEYRNDKRCYYVQFGSDWSYRGYETKEGKHLRKDLNEIVKITDTISEDGWFYDIQTESQTFATGPNLFKIHNSPRRGEVFVTGNFVKQVVEMEKGLREPILHVGNTSSVRDWTDARDVVRAAWLSTELCNPGDVYNVCSGKAYTIDEFIERMREVAKIDFKIKVDEDRIRPSDVTWLLGNPSKFVMATKWERKYDFMRDTVPEMFQYWRKRVK